MALMDSVEALVLQAGRLAEQAAGEGHPDLSLILLTMMSDATDWAECHLDAAADHD